MTMITPSYLGETIEYSSLHACRSTLEDPTSQHQRDDPQAGEVGGRREMLEEGLYRAVGGVPPYIYTMNPSSENPRRQLLGRRGPEGLLHRFWTSSKGSIPSRRGHKEPLRKTSLYMNSLSSSSRRGPNPKTWSARSVSKRNQHLRRDSRAPANIRCDRITPHN